jgi:hypothetical protein
MNRMDDAIPATQTPRRRYAVSTGPGGLRRVVRTDGRPLGYVRLRRQRPAGPEPAAGTGNAPRDRDLAAFAAAMRARVAQRRMRRPAPSPGTAPVPTPEQLVRWRREAGLGQRGLAARCGLSRSYLAAVETGRRAPADVRRRLAAHLGHGDPSEWGG